MQQAVEPSKHSELGCEAFWFVSRSNSRPAPDGGTCGQRGMTGLWITIGCFLIAWWIYFRNRVRARARASWLFWRVSAIAVLLASTAWAILYRWRESQANVSVHNFMNPGQCYTAAGCPGPDPQVSTYSTDFWVAVSVGAIAFVSLLCIWKRERYLAARATCEACRLFIAREATICPHCRTVVARSSDQPGRSS